MRLTVIVLVLALVAAACGGEDAVTTSTTGDSVRGMLIASELQRAAPDAPEPDLAAVADGLADFAAGLYGRLAAADGNLVFSPVSVYVAMAMTYAGASGSTSEEMAAVLGDELGGEAFHSAMNALDQALESRNRDETDQEGSVELSVVNSLWGQQGYEFRQAFLDLLALDYGAGMRIVDFTDPAAREQARAAINDWLAGETNGRIDELIQQGVLDDLVRLVLVNAVYLNAAWATPFLEESTSNGEFVLLDGSIVQVPFMHQSDSFRYATGDGWQAVELPYAGRELAMLLIVPDQESFADVEAALDDGLLDRVADGLSFEQVVLALPTFEIRTQAELIPMLQALGLTEATGTSADFSGMTGGQDLFISDVVHEAWISADEAGTEAAAATAVMMSLTAAPVAEIDLTVDRPFLFVLHDLETGSILFMGRVLDPGS